MRLCVSNVCHRNVRFCVLRISWMSGVRLWFHKDWGRPKIIFAEGHGCLCFLWYCERPQIVILWVGWFAGEVEMARYWWEASFGCVLVDRPTSVRQRTWLSWANKLDSDIIRLCCCLDYFFFTDGIYLLPTSYYYDFHKWAKCDPWTVKK